ncbi:hypothetical protein L596_017442 [Steinernema carpocapsae]|uniref:7TM GPCR serpentine receptor class x (Srx) domain-containing protein n=1 Tax=Steinernema carpocapsae TaxID=34508 RepID=A0A4U5N2D8_STECR|nr:hypothetical protein L596_017442 [Steinernema carpocapsae]
MATEESSYAFHTFCVAALTTIGIPGIIINILCLIMLRKIPRFRNAFGSLCISRCISNLLFLTTMVVANLGRQFA